jgi:hypothetical protein
VEGAWFAWFEEAQQMAPLYTGGVEVCPFWGWAMGHIFFFGMHYRVGATVVTIIRAAHGYNQR